MRRSMCNQRYWLSALPLDQTLLGVWSMFVAIFLEGKYFLWESDISSNTLDNWQSSRKEKRKKMY